MRTAPDGTVYIADMYHGIIQEREWTPRGSYLRHKIEQYQLDKVIIAAASGGCVSTAARCRHAGGPAGRSPAAGRAGIEPTAPPRMFDETPAQLVAHLSHPNGWWRDTAQRLLVLRQDKSVVPALQTLARTS